MLPSGLAVALLLLSLVPGWAYLRLRERLRPQSRTGGIHELLEVLAVGLATTGVSAAFVAVAPHAWFPFLIDLDAWARGGNDYLRSHVRPVIVTGIFVLALAHFTAYLVYRLQKLRLPAEFRAQQSVWVHALGTRPKGKVPYVGVQLRDGLLIEGVLHSFSLDEAEMGERDVALQRPIRITAKRGERPSQLPNLDRLVVPGGSIDYITVIHLQEASPQQNQR